MNANRFYQSLATNHLYIPRKRKEMARRLWALWAAMVVSAIAFPASVLAASEAGVVAEHFEKVTSMDQIVVGKEYILVAETEGKAVGPKDGDYRSAVDVTVVDNRIDASGATGVTVFTLGVSGKVYTLKASEDGYYLGGKSGVAVLTTFSSASDNQKKWKIDTDFTVNCAADVAKYVQYRGGSYKRFGNYSGKNKDGNEAAVLYVRVPESVSVNISQFEFTSLYYSDKNIKVPSGDLVAVTYSGFDSGNLVQGKTYKSGEVIPAGTAVVLHGTANATYRLETVGSAGSVQSPDSNLLRGLDEAGLVVDEGGDNYYYKLTTKNGTDFGFYWGVAGGAPFELKNAHRAYLVLPKSAFEGDSNGSNGFALFFDEEVLAISMPSTDAPAAIDDGAFYDLQGRRMAAGTPLKRGVYVHHGRKIVIK